MKAETLVRADAKKRGWSIVRRSQELGATGVPCFLEPDVPGRCEIWVGVGRDSDQLQAGLAWQGGNVHVADIRGLTKGSVYDRLGQAIGNVTRTGDKNSCSISIKKNAGDYQDAWDALKTYIHAIYSGFLSSDNNNIQQAKRPYTFQILGEKSREEIQWFDLVRGDKIAIIGLGGVGAWIADLMTKTDVIEIHGWDEDVIEEKNIIRMPGAVSPKWVGKAKAMWFQKTYRKIHKKVYGHAENITERNVQKICNNITFAFVAIDNEKGRKIICEHMTKHGIPFIDIGLSLNRNNDNQLCVSIRISIALPYDETWQKSIPAVDKAGQEIYGKLELPDVAAMAAGWAVQYWRKMRGQLAQEKPQECMKYQADTNMIIPRNRDKS